MLRLRSTDHAAADALDAARLAVVVVRETMLTCRWCELAPRKDNAASRGRYRRCRVPGWGHWCSPRLMMKWWWRSAMERLANEWSDAAVAVLPASFGSGGEMVMLSQHAGVVLRAQLRVRGVAKRRVRSAIRAREANAGGVVDDAARRLPHCGRVVDGVVTDCL